MGDLVADLRYALRSWMRQPGFMLVAVLSLACGIGLNTAVFSIINAIFARWTLEPVTIAGVLAMFSVAALGACYLPGRRAIRLDPMSVLRAD